MKKKVSVLLIITAVFCIAVYLGIFLGRTYGRDLIYLTDSQQEHQDFWEQALPVDLNRADSVALMRIPEMTDELAQAIIRYRETYGDYVLVSELRSVPGMTQFQYDRIKNYVYVAD